jgi:hypothetical protein
MAVEELGGRHQILKWPNSPTVFCFIPSCSTSRDDCGRTGRQASDLKVAKCPNCSLFQSILFYIPRWLWKNWEAGKITALMMDLDVGVVSEVLSLLFHVACHALRHVLCNMFYHVGRKSRKLKAKIF